jgi:hypothetical protein
MRKKWIIGIVAGVAVVGGIVTAIICHKRRRDAFRELDLYDDEDDEFWDEDLDDEDCESGEKCCEYAERILRELEEGTYYGE